MSVGLLMAHSFFGPVRDEQYMKQALAGARRAAKQGEVPVGALIVDSSGTVIARAHNKVEQRRCQAAHAEMQAIEKAARALGNWRLEGCWLYVTLEPCLMCMGLIGLSRLSGVVYAAPSPLFGSRLDTQTVSPVYNFSTLVLISGVQKEESEKLLKDFFKKRRSEGE